jgi:hypothetical protein
MTRRKCIIFFLPFFRLVRIYTSVERSVAFCIQLGNIMQIKMILNKLYFIMSVINTEHLCSVDDYVEPEDDGFYH